MQKFLFFLITLFFSGSLLAVYSDYCVSCERDSHGHIKRSLEAKKAFKKMQPCPSTAKSFGPCPGYIIDHIIRSEEHTSELQSHSLSRMPSSA